MMNYLAIYLLISASVNKVIYDTGYKIGHDHMIGAAISNYDRSIVLWS
jgi:hypothetical protein